MKAAYRISILLGFISIGALAQIDVDDQSNWMDRVYFGGGGSFGGGTSNGIKYTYLSVSPVVGYMVTSQFSAGSGFIYQRTSYSDIKFTYDQYGIMPFVRYNFNNFFVTAEYNYINLPLMSYSNLGYKVDARVYRSRMFLGAGFSQPLGGRGRINAMVMYDVLYQPNSGFYSPLVYRVFFSF